MDKNARQLQKKIRELEKVNRDLASSNQILTDKNIQLEENISEELNLWRSRHGLNMPVSADRVTTTSARDSDVRRHNKRQDVTLCGNTAQQKGV